MFDLDEYLQKLIAECRKTFGGRLLYAGLQGSYMRGEAHPDSDIDVMIIIDRFSVEDMDTYRDILERVGYSDKACGFICGRDEMIRWNPLEICQLRFTTKDLYGSLNDYLPEASRADEINYVKISLGNLYHELCHRYIHTDRNNNEAKFRFTCKGLFFLIQNMHYLESGEFFITRRALMEHVPEEDKRMLMMADLMDGFDFSESFRTVFEWCQSAFRRIDMMQ